MRKSCDKVVECRANQATVGDIFSKYVHCDMRFLVEKIAHCCFLDGSGI